jgi:hypothetical protein
MAIRNSQMLVDGMEQEAQLSSSQQRDRLLNAARMFFYHYPPILKDPKILLYILT